MRDTANARWTDAEIYATINEALFSWQGRVLPANMYLSISLDSGRNGYALPSYVHPPVRVQFSSISPDDWSASYEAGASTDDVVWTDAVGWSLENTADAYVLRFHHTPPDCVARIIWCADLGPVPTAAVTLTGGWDGATTTNPLTAAQTSMVLGTVLQLPMSGWVLIEQEWIQYAGIDVGAEATRLDNLVRGANNTTAASHAAGVAVVFGIPATNPALYTQLIDQTRALLHALYLTNGAPGETTRHQQMTNFYLQKAEGFWRGWVDPNMSAMMANVMRPRRIVGLVE